MERTDAVIIDSVEEVVDPSIFTSSNGIVFKLNKVSKMLIVESARKIKTPRPPKWFNEEKSREEENPNDPDYLEQLSDSNWKRGNISIAVYLTMGTRVQSLPDNIEPPDSDEWIETLSELGVEISTGKRSRYVDWLKYYALDDDDLNRLVAAVMAYSGVVIEAEVKTAEDSFRS